MNVDHECRWDNLPFIFPYVFRTYFILSRLDVISSLDKRCIERDTKQKPVKPASVVENNLHVTFENETLFLLLCELEKNTSRVLCTI